MYYVWGLPLGIGIILIAAATLARQEYFIKYMAQVIVAKDTKINTKLLERSGIVICTGCVLLTYALVLLIDTLRRG